MAYEPRRIAFLGREGRVKHYGIALGYGEARRPLTAAVRRLSADLPGPGFTIAHDAASAALGIVYWWANDNEIHSAYFVAPLDDPGALEPLDDPTGMACVWELEVIDFERRAWLDDVMKGGDYEAYLGRALSE